MELVITFLQMTQLRGEDVDEAKHRVSHLV